MNSSTEWDHRANGWSNITDRIYPSLWLMLGVTLDVCFIVGNLIVVDTSPGFGWVKSSVDGTLDLGLSIL